jgi:hypothetical protein
LLNIADARIDVSVNNGGDQMAEDSHTIRDIVIGAVGAFTVLTTAGFTWVLPTMMAAKDHQIELLQEQKDKLTTERDTATKNKEAAVTDALAQKMMADNERQVSDDLRRESLAQKSELEKQLFASSLVNTFSTNNPYPVGIDRVRLGDNTDKIAQVYGTEKLKVEKAFTSVILDDGLFLRVTYHRRPDGVINGIAYSTNALRRISKRMPRLPDDWLSTSLVRTLGEPVIIGSNDDCQMWRPSHDVIVFMLKGDDLFYLGDYTALPAGCDITEEQKKLIIEYDKKAK